MISNFWISFCVAVMMSTAASDGQEVKKWLEGFEIVRVSAFRWHEVETGGSSFLETRNQKLLGKFSRTLSKGSAVHLDKKLFIEPGLVLVLDLGSADTEEGREKVIVLIEGEPGFFSVWSAEKKELRYVLNDKMSEDHLKIDLEEEPMLSIHRLFQFTYSKAGKP